MAWCGPDVRNQPHATHRKVAQDGVLYLQGSLGRRSRAGYQHLSPTPHLPLETHVAQAAQSMGWDLLPSYKAELKSSLTFGHVHLKQVVPPWVS